MNYLKEFQIKFTPIASAYFDIKIKELFRIHPEGGNLGKIIKDFTIKGGKKFRPALFYAAYSSYETRHLQTVLNFSLIFEIIQSFALIHDDIIDHSALRRGYPTLHVQYDKERAILLGDLALILADDLFTKNISQFPSPKEIKKKCLDCYSMLKQEVLIGEYLDYIKNKDVQTIMLLKTARYSFARPIELGLMLAGAEASVINQWVEMATKTGIIFQLKDDYMGTFDTEKNIGKSVTSDIEEGKNTHIVQLFLTDITDKEKKRFNTFFGKGKVNMKNFEWYKSLLIKKGIQKKAQEKIKANIVDLKNSLGSFDSSLILVKLLNEIIEKLGFFSS